MESTEKTLSPLWTRDFTIITLGSVVSMLGNALSGFAMSLMVLDISQSTLLYAIYIAMYTLPQLIVPIISGAVLDRFSRKKTIYTLDFISAFLYALMAVILATGWFSFPLFAVYCFILGSIQSTYMVAYESFYPLLISKGNFQKAYSIASVLEALCFFIAAVMETQIRANEQYLQTQEETKQEEISSSRQVLEDIREGFSYLRGEKGLLAIAVYFFFSAICGGVSSVIVLPWFKSAFNNGEYYYMLVWGMALVGRAIGGLIHYRVTIPAKVRYSAALTVYVVISVLEGVYLYTPVPVMMILCFLVGIGGLTSYTIRISATQSYVPDERKGRFNGAFNMLSTAGALLGELLAGLLTLLVPERVVLLAVMLLCALAAVVVIGGGRKHVALIYNRNQ